MVYINTQNQIRLLHTSEMEKAMHHCHGIGYAEYERSLEKRIQVEKTREKDYRKCNTIAAEQDHKII